MATDIFGYDKTVSRLISSDQAGIKLKGADFKLVQNVRFTYQHQVIPRFEAGSADLYWISGQSQGSATFGRAVSQQGFLDGVNGLGQAARVDGDLLEFQVGVGPGGGGAGDMTNRLTFGGGLFQSIGGSINTQGLDVSSEINLVFGSLGAGGGDA